MRKGFVWLVGLSLISWVGLAQEDYTLFESGQVRPLALSPDGSRLFATNTPDGRLEIFATTVDGLDFLGSVVVGMEPVAVAARNNNEVWVVNHLSDSVSIVDVSDPGRAFVRRTLLVGDEPRDIVFAGSGGNRAFITCAHRGQNHPEDPSLTTPGVGRADIWVFDAGNLGTAMGGNELAIVNLFGDTLRALAVSPDGALLYAAVFHSGNQTTTLSEGVVPNGGPGNGGLPAPTTNFEGTPAPETGLIVRFDGTHWTDELDRNWDASVRFDLPDFDVFTIDANRNPPEEVDSPFSGVGTILYNMTVHPESGKVYVSNTEAHNEVRFEGPGTFAGSTVRGKLHTSRITVLEAGASPLPRHLNKHIDYAACCEPVPNETNRKSLAFPTEMTFSEDGQTLYVSAFGSAKLGVFDVTQLEEDTFVPGANHIGLSAGGPTGLVGVGNRLYCLTRFDNGISIIDTESAAEIGHVTMFHPEGEEIITGRRFLYDAAYTSSHGDQACGSCHVFGDLDSLAWDLGNPDDTVLNNPNPFTVGPIIDPDFHPMKGPMTTQSLRGMDNHGPMHWRGDRTGGNDQANSQPDGGAYDEEAAFAKFNGAFEGLVGRAAPLTDEEMIAFTRFSLKITYPPNPLRNLDNSLTAAQQRGHDFYFGAVSDAAFNCNGCHTIDRAGNSGSAAPGFFGGDGGSSFENEPQIMKVPHLRNLYQKVGMFGMAPTPFMNQGNNSHMGDQIRGFGFMHDGSADTLFRFFNSVVFNRNVLNPGGFPSGAAGDAQRRDLEAFVLAADSNLFPIVGQQVTLSPASVAEVDTRVTLLLARADANECRVVAHGEIGAETRGYLYAGGVFQSDRAGEPSLTEAELRAMARLAGNTLTFTATPLNSGTRIGLDRDRDGYLNRDELDAGSNPGDPNSTPVSFASALPLWAVSPLCGAPLVTIRELIGLLDGGCP